MTDKDFGVWDGEKTIDLPGETDAGLYFIGRIRTPWKARKECPKNAHESDAVCTVELDERFRDALKDVESCSHLVLLYWMDKSPRNLVLQVPGHYGVQRGTFALRSPGPAQPDRLERGQAAGHCGQHTIGRGARLPRRHALARHQALFPLHRQRAGGRGGLAQNPQIAAKTARNAREP